MEEKVYNYKIYTPNKIADKITKLQLIIILMVK